MRVENFKSLYKMKDEILLKQIADHQLFYGSFCKSPGLGNGKMGVVLFLFLYARAVKNSLYEDFGGEMLEEILETLSEHLPICFSHGLCGIAWAIAYLFREGFIEGDCADVLKDMDDKIMEHDPLRITDYTFETGLRGIAYYVSYRLEHHLSDSEIFDTIYIKEIQNCFRKNGYTLDKYSEKDVLFRITEERSTQEFSWQRGLRLLLQ